ncbi:MAG: phosphatidylglycerol lysyltransferase domain-containing protein [Alphaproteobacteria bacterium]|nr:phosphatidylglycerol lysyltransferase domain-containing protein [Alphaproteobacteria bacterium]
MRRLNSSLKFIASTSLSIQMEEWEIEASLLGRFLRLTKENWDLFFAFLGKEKDLDSYLTSPVYYALTGRKGLWLYQDGNTYVPVCWHPNVDGQILIFPPRGEENSKILQKLLTEIPIPPAGIRIARIKKEDIHASFLRDIKCPLGRSVALSQIEETVLDWHFPVRTLSTERVKNMSGSDFMKARNHLKQMKKHKTSVVPLTPFYDKQVIEFANRWASNRTTNPHEIKELISPYIETMSLIKDESFRLGGHIFFVDEKVQAVTMWELPNNALQIANAWVSLCNAHCNGLSEFVMKTTAEALWERGIPYINYGGSETKGLDDYKNKYVPVYSLDLCSIDVALEGFDPILRSLIEIQNSRIAA